MPCPREPTGSIHVRLPDSFDPSVDGDAMEAVVRRRRAVVAGTLVAGTAVLAGTLAADPGSALFYGLGLLAAVTWTAGAFLSGPIQLWRRAGTAARRPRMVGPILLGAALFAAFFAAKLIADRIPILAGSVASVLARAHTGPRSFVLVVALINGLGEEVFFRGAVHAAFGKHHAAIWATAIYAVVTIATLNLSLVAAAVVVGTVFSAERRATGGVLAPILTHLSWSTLMLVFLPR